VSTHDKAKKAELGMTNSRIFFVTDLHGSELCFKKFLNAAKVYNANVLILGGDLTGKMIVPIVDNNGHWNTKFLGKDTQVKSRDELSKLEMQIRSCGYYPYTSNQKEIDDLNSSPDKVRTLFMNLMLEQVNRWMALAEERLVSSGVQLYVTGGNDDPLEIEPVLNKSNYVINPENRVVDIGEGMEMVSSGFGNITPWKCPRDIEEDALLAKLESIASQVHTTERAVFNLHVPPYDSGLDMAPQLDKTLKVDTHAGTGVTMIPVGSTAVRKIIEKYQPMIGLHGHIHESRGVAKIGRTTCINPGSEYGEGFLRGVAIDLDRKGFTYVLTSG